MRKGLEWWNEARFGMFIHFGIYSGLAGEWRGQEIPGIGEWIQNRAKIPLKEYREYAGKLTLEEFDAEEYVQLAKAAGMKYIVFTAKHHDGFAMYHSEYSEYNIVRMGPSGRDPVKELADAAHKAGIKMCLYYSQALDWEDPDATGNDWDYDPGKKDFRRFLDGKCKHQLIEILTQYGDLGLIWFDVPRGITREQSMELRNLVKQYQPGCLVSGRISREPGIGDYGSMGDNVIPAGKLKGYWETPATLNHTWGYKKNDQNWKTPEELIRLMTELLSKGVNYLLNIGPMASGKIPEESVAILKEVGKWVHLNEEAVYGTTATPFSMDFEWGKASAKGNTIYLYLNNRESHLELSGIRNEILRASLIGTPDQEVMTEQFHDTELDEHNVKLDIPESHNPYQDVIRLELRGEIDVKEGLYQQTDGTVFLPGYAADLEGESSTAVRRGNDPADREAEKAEFAEKKIQLNSGGMIENWFSEKGKASWKFFVYRPGRYRISLVTRSEKYAEWVGGHTVCVKCSGQTLEKKLTADRPLPYADKFFFDDQISDLGFLSIDHAGELSLELTMLECNKEDQAGLCVNKMMLDLCE
ncbi:MAG: alpha-L-fucosidase [Fusicatenibacter sp.]